MRTEIKELKILLFSMVVFIVLFLSPIESLCAVRTQSVQAEEIQFLTKTRSILTLSKRKLNLQTEMPSSGNKMTEPVDSKRLPAADSNSKLQTDVPTQPQPKAITPKMPSMNSRFASFLLYAALIGIIAAVLFTLRQNLWSFSRSRPVLSKPVDLYNPEGEAITARMEKAQLKADDLAEIGDFAGAIHTLLLQSIAELRSRLGLHIAASLTSREILSKINLPEKTRFVLEDIISCVEVSYFGMYSPGIEDYRLCRGNFDVLIQSLAKELV